MKELRGYRARHHEDLEKTFTDEQKEIFEKFHDCWDEYVSLNISNSQGPRRNEYGKNYFSFLK